MLNNASRLFFLSKPFKQSYASPYSIYSITTGPAVNGQKKNTKCLLPVNHAWRNIYDEILLTGADIAKPHGIWYYNMAASTTTWLLVLPHGYWHYYIASGTTTCHLVLPHGRWHYNMAADTTTWQLTLPNDCYVPGNSRPLQHMFLLGNRVNEMYLLVSSK